MFGQMMHLNIDWLFKALLAIVKGFIGPKIVGKN